MNKVIAKATQLELPLIGSSALALWADSYGDTFTRKPRDLDFICYDAERSKRFSIFRTWCILNNESPDVYSVHNEKVFNYTTKIDGVLTLTLPALFYRLLVRNTKKSLEDCKWILSRDYGYTDEEFQSTLEDLGIDDELLTRFNKLYE